MHEQLHEAQAYAEQCKRERQTAKDNEAAARLLVEHWKGQYLALVEERKQQTTTSIAEELKHTETVLKLQHDLDRATESEARLKDRLVSARQEKDDLAFRLKELEQDISQHAFDVDLNLREELANVRSELDGIKADYNVLDARHKALQLRCKESTETARASRLRVAELEAELDTQNAAVEHARERARRLERDAQSSDALRAELASARAEIDGLLARAAAADEVAQLRTELLQLVELSDRQEVRAQQAEQKLAEALDKVQEREVLREQVQGLREALNSAQEVTGERDIKNVLQDYQRRELEAAQNAGKQLETIARLQASEAALQERCDELQAQLQEAAERQSEATSANASLAASVQVYKAQNTTLQQVVEVLQQEASVAPQAAPPTMQPPQPALHQQIQDLNRNLLQSQALVDELRAAAQAKNDEIGALRDAKGALVAQLSEEKRVGKKLERQAQQLQDQVAQLQLRLGAGDVGHARGRVLHLKMNPAAASRADFLRRELETVQAENEALRERVLSLECSAGGGSVAHTGGVEAGVTRLQAELRVAQQTVADMKARNEKMTTHFVDASRTFREAVGQILGWSMKMILKPGERDLVHFRLKPFGDQSNSERYLVLTSFKGALELDVDAEWLTTQANAKLVSFYYSNPATRSIPSLLANLLLNQ